MELKHIKSFSKKLTRTLLDPLMTKRNIEPPFVDAHPNSNPEASQRHRILNEKITERRVDFLICGTQKGGTSALDSYLRAHPIIKMATNKEVHYFDNDLLFQGGEPDYSIYHAAFPAAEADHLLGESTPIYMYWDSAARRIWRYNPKMKLIVLLRNPIDRAYSHWNMARERGRHKLSFSEAIHLEGSIARAALPERDRVFSYIDRGFYLEQLRRLWRFFPRESVLVLKSEELKNNPSKELGRVCDFLGIEQFQEVKKKIVHARPYESPMEPSDRSFLLDLYEFEIRGIERVLSWDCHDWLRVQ